MLEKDPKKRISFEKIFKHNFFEKFNIKHLRKKVEDDSIRIKSIETLYKNIITLNLKKGLSFQHATFAYIVHHLAKKEDIAEMRRLFLEFESSGLGMLTYDDILKGVQQVKDHYNIDDKNLTNIFKYVDYDDSKLIEYEGN